MKFVVVGGGTAGWLTALFVQKNIPYSDVTVVSSSEIGILGAGEGTNWDFVQFLHEIDIPVADIIKYARGTFKNGIKFTNWNGDSKSFYHPFLDHLGKKEFKEKSNFDPMPFYLNKISAGETLSDIQFTTIISERNRLKYKKDTQEELGISSLHFDANLLAQHLQSVGIKRGIKHINDEVTEFVTNKSGDISKLKLKSGNECDVGFIFDCSGFKRLIIGEFYKSTWTSYKDSLPVNRAMPFFIEHDDTEIPPYTEAIAMKYGWMWKIPVQGRFGCGYVFDSRLVSDEDIKKELTEYLGFEPVVPRIFNFEPGAYKDTWINNCIAIGLSAGFVEPLEATSIQVTTISLRAFATKIKGLVRDRKKAIEEFNREVKHINDHVLNFLHFHYLTKRTDTEFWKSFTKNNTAPEFVKKFIDISKKTIPRDRDFEYINLTIDPNEMRSKPFSVFSWQMIGGGIGYFNPNVANRDLESYKNFNMVDSEKALLSMLNSIAEDTYRHYDYIEYLKNT
jgi:tryptophan 7-halogenase